MTKSGAARTCPRCDYVLHDIADAVQVRCSECGLVTLVKDLDSRRAWKRTAAYRAIARPTRVLIIAVMTAIPLLIGLVLVAPYVPRLLIPTLALFVLAVLLFWAGAAERAVRLFHGLPAMRLMALHHGIGLGYAFLCALLAGGIVSGCLALINAAWGWSDALRIAMFGILWLLLMGGLLMVLRRIDRHIGRRCLGAEESPANASPSA